MEALILSANDPELWSKLHPKKLSTTIFVTPTDTVYGLNTSASNLEGIERIRKLKHRQAGQFIYLVRTVEEAERFVSVSDSQRQILQRYWPGAISFVLKRIDREETAALRMPSFPFLQRLMEVVGEPLVSTSCNRHGEKPVETLQEAISLFQDSVDLYIDGGKLLASASTLVDITQMPPQILRQGNVKFLLKSTN